MNIYKNQDSQLLEDLKQLIDDTRFRIATSINSGIVISNWKVGKRISDELLANQRAEYGKLQLRLIQARSYFIIPRTKTGLSSSSIFSVKAGYFVENFLLKSNALIDE